MRAAVGLAEDEAIVELVDAYERADVSAALERLGALADAGRDLAQVAAQAEREARTRLFASAGDPARARRLAAILRTVAEAAGAGAREGRARLALELLAVEIATSPVPVAAIAVTTEAAAAPSAERRSRSRNGSLVKMALPLT